ncbi:hypothetical protein ACFYOV_12835 [Streptomyces sp. NPDC005931]|uniref:hypothetical protein n=1 Tax=Streptomyces sp. NPDC005931 TaxID=3364737 RepID=UPI00369BE5A7
MYGWTGRVRYVTASLGVWAAALALTLCGASSASAGGPTSVLLANPESMATASLSSGDEEYGALERLLGRPGAGTRRKPPEAEPASARWITVTWMLHDVAPWRVDRVYPADRGNTVWIHTAADLEEPANGHWHRAEHPSELRALLKELGVLGGASDEGSSAESSSGLYPAPWGAGETGSTAVGTPPSGARQKTTAAAVHDGTDWWWAIPGGAAGAALALVLRPHVMRLPLTRREKEPGPRQEVLDV